MSGVCSMTRGKTNSGIRKKNKKHLSEVRIHDMKAIAVKYFPTKDTPHRTHQQKTNSKNKKDTRKKDADWGLQ